MTSQLIQKAVSEVEKLRKYHKEFECNGANGGKGCYEMFCEDQECKNAPKEYNQAISDIQSLLPEIITGVIEEIIDIVCNDDEGYESEEIRRARNRIKGSIVGKLEQLCALKEVVKE